MTKRLSAPITSLHGKSAATILTLALSPSLTTVSYLWQYGAADEYQYMDALFNNVGAAIMSQQRITASGINQVSNTLANLGYVYPRVGVIKYSTAHTPAAIACSVDEMTGTVISRSGPDPAPGTLGDVAGPFVFGSDFGVTLPFAGIIGAWVIAPRELDAVEQADLVQYLRWLARRATTREVTFVGDSITAGGANSFSQWRHRIQDRFDAAPDLVTVYNACGHAHPAGNPTWAQDYSLSGGGNTTFDIVSLLASRNYGVDFQPDLWVVMIGTNNLDTGILNETPAQLAAHVDSLCTDLWTRRPGVPIKLMKLTTRTDATAPKIIDYNNNYIDGVAASARSRGIDVEVNDTFYQQCLAGQIVFNDSEHPSVFATNVMGDALYPFVRQWMGLPP